MGKFRLSAQVRDLALFVGNGTKVRVPSEFKLPLAIITSLLMGATIRFSDTATLRKGILRFFLVEFTNNIFEVNGMVELENVKKSLF